MGGVATHTIPVRAHPASPGTICAASRCAGAGPLALRGPHWSRRLGRRGGSHSGSPLGRGGPSLQPRGVGAGAPAAGGPAGGRGGGGGVAPRPPCSRSRRRPVVLLPGSLCVAGALPSGARLRSGLKCRPVAGGVRGGPWTAPLGASFDLTPSLRHLGAGCGYGRVMWGAASFLLRRARWGGAGAAWRPWSRGPATTESWMPAQALAGALTSPAVAARRRPAGGG